MSKFQKLTLKIVSISFLMTSVVGFSAKAQVPDATDVQAIRLEDTDPEFLGQVSPDDLKIAEDVVADQVTKSPDDHEVKLSFHERILLAKVFVSLGLRGLGMQIHEAIGKIDGHPDRGNTLKDLAEQKLKPFENNLLKLFTDLSNEGKLRPYIWTKMHELVKAPIVGSQLKGLTYSKMSKAVDFSANNIEEAIRLKGMSNDSKLVHYIDWTDVDAMWMKRLNERTLVPVIAYGSSTADQFKILVSGPASFTLREKLFDSAQHSIDIIVWAIYDDVTGNWLLRKLTEVKKNHPDLKVRIVIDGQTSSLSGYHAVADKIAALGIPLIKWTNPKAPFAGMHRKIMVIDGEHVIAGGMNFGDDYSHMNPKGEKWRDTDVYVHGNFARDVAQKFFDQFWDSSVDSLGLQYEKSPARNFPQQSVEEVASSLTQQNSVVLLNQDPIQFPEGSPIFTALMNDLMTAKTSVDIENAYIIAIPAFTEAIHRAVQRGVRMRVFTNSDQSVDEKSIGDAMKITASKLLAAGADVYLRKGSTLHSKFAIVDNEKAYVMSYNLHPRSEKIEGEIAIQINNQAFAQQLDQVFENDITDVNTATRITNQKQLDVSMGYQLWLLLRLMYDQL